MSEHELERKNMRLGWALFGLFVLLFGLTVAVALIYLAVD
jgi:nitrogen fixation protein FixH